MSTPVTNPGAQWATDASVAARLQPVMVYFDEANSTWMATTDPTDTTGKPVATVIVIDGVPYLDNELPPGLKTVLKADTLIAFES